MLTDDDWFNAKLECFVSVYPATGKVYIILPDPVEMPENIRTALVESGKRIEGANHDRILFDTVDSWCLDWHWREDLKAKGAYAM